MNPRNKSQSEFLLQDNCQVLGCETWFEMFSLRINEAGNKQSPGRLPELHAETQRHCRFQRFLSHSQRFSQLVVAQWSSQTVITRAEVFFGFCLVSTGQVHFLSSARWSWTLNSIPFIFSKTSTSQSISRHRVPGLPSPWNPAAFRLHCPDSNVVLALVKEGKHVTGSNV